MSKKLIEKLVLNQGEKKTLNVKLPIAIHNSLDYIAKKIGKSKGYVASLILEEEVPKLEKMIKDKLEKDNQSDNENDKNETKKDKLEDLQEVKNANETDIQSVNSETQFNNNHTTFNPFNRG